MILLLSASAQVLARTVKKLNNKILTFNEFIICLRKITHPKNHTGDGDITSRYSMRYH